MWNTENGGISHTDDAVIQEVQELYREPITLGNTHNYFKYIDMSGHKLHSIILFYTRRFPLVM